MLPNWSRASTVAGRILTALSQKSIAQERDEILQSSSRIKITVSQGLASGQF